MKYEKPLATTILAVMALSILSAGCSKSKNESGNQSMPPEQVRLLRELSEKTVAEGSLSEPLVNEFGIRRKVVTRNRGIRCGTNLGGPRDGEELRYFHPYFMFEEKQHGEVTHYLVSSTPRRFNVLGWVTSQDVQEWDTRMGNRLKRKEKPSDTPLPPLFVFASGADVRSSIQGNKVEPVAKSSYEYEHQTLMPWPVISKETFEHNGHTYEIHQIAFLGCYQEGADVSKDPSAVTSSVTTTSEEERKELIETVRAGFAKVDVVFVMDTTGSMNPYIEQVKESVKNISTKLGNLSFKPDLAFGIVEYRDYEDGFPDGKPIRFHQLVEDQAAFFKVINGISSDAGGDDQEAVFDGIKAALTMTAWRGNLSERIVILVGDFSAHEPGSSQNPENISMDQLVNLAGTGNNKTRIFSLRVENRGDSEEKKRHETQFTQIAQKTSAQSFALSNVSDLVPAVEKVITLRADDRSKGFEVLEEATKGNIDFTREAPKRDVVVRVDDRKIVEVLEFLKGAGIDYEKLAPGQTAFSTGWVVTESAGTEILEKEVYLARSELNSLMSNLYALVNVLQKPEMMESLVAGSLMTRVAGLFPGLQTYFQDETMEKMDVWLLVQMVPVGGHSILNFSKDEIRHMPEAQRMSIAQQIQDTCIPSLTAEGRNTTRFTEPDPISFGWVRERFLP